MVLSDDATKEEMEALMISALGVGDIAQKRLLEALVLISSTKVGGRGLLQVQGQLGLHWDFVYKPPSTEIPKKKRELCMLPHTCNPVQVGVLKSSSYSSWKPAPYAMCDFSKTNNTPFEKPGMMGHTCNPRIQEAEAELLQV